MVRSDASEVTAEEILSGVREAVADGNGAAVVAHLARSIREGRFEGTEARVEALCLHLENQPELARDVGDAVRSLLVDLRVGPALTESGVSSATGFAAELAGRLTRRFLPDLEEPGDLRAILRHAFSGRDDHLRIASVPDQVFARFMTALGVTADSVKGVDPELGSAIRAIAHHIGSLGMRPEFTSRLPQLENPDSPFLELSDRVLEYIRSYENGVDGDEFAHLQEALDTIGLCRASVELLRSTTSDHGTSLGLTGLTFRLLQLLDRLEVLLHLTDPVQRDFQASATRLFREILHAEKTRNHVGPHLRERADLLVFEVVEHAAKKGSKYITAGRRDYWSFFLASLGGGFIVAVSSFLKTIVSGWSVPLGVEAILYGLIYSACFIVIYLTGAALATKQPAMTANTIARALGNPDDRHLDQLEALVVRVWRSQFVSFVGNLAMALPMAFLLSEMLFQTTGGTVADPDKALSMLGRLHPWQSGTVLFAAIAGVFLFAAGLLSGWVDNRNLYSHIPQRVASHPLLTRMLGAGGAASVASFLDRNLGAVVGNVFLGFALGSTGTFGEILGLPLDIRHIAFASAEFGTSLEILHFDVAWAVGWPVALGVALIGLVNFVVSFGLSLATALESRRITWAETRTLLSHLVRGFFNRPLDWFFPPKSGR